MLKRIKQWNHDRKIEKLRRLLTIYPNEIPIPIGFHIHKDPTRKPKPLTEAATLNEIYPGGKE
jgi:hypothetical protein